MKSKKATKKTTVELSAGVNPHAAGIDIGATEIYVAVREDAEGKPIRSFTSFTDDLHRIGDWLLACGVTTVAMESTGVYWIPLYQVLESKGLEVYLVNAREVKNVPGRKTDVKDCQWLLTLHTHGLLRGSFHPEESIKALRAIHRHRDQLVQSGACFIQHIEKALSQMNIQIHHVLSDITGVSGQAILDAIVSGQRDPKILATLRDPRVRADQKTVERSLTGDWKSEHLFALKQALEAYRFFQGKIIACDEELRRLMNQLESRTEPTQPLAPTTGKKKWGPKSGGALTELNWETQLHRIFGVNLLEVPGISINTALVFLSEVGADLSSFASEHHFGSWLRLAPHNKISGGKILSSQTCRNKSKLGLALRMAAQSLYHSKSELGDVFRRLKARLGAPKAITAMAYRLARILFVMISKKQNYDANHSTKNEMKRLLKKQNWLQKQLAEVSISLTQYQQVAN